MKKTSICRCGGTRPEPNGRRSFIQLALGAGAALSFRKGLAEEQGDSNARPQSGDRFVFSDSSDEPKEITPADLVPGAPQVLAWPKDPATHTVRNGSRLNQVLLVRFDPASLDDETRPHAAEGIVAYSAVCTHAQCSVVGWNQQKQVLHCDCHQSEYDPRQNAKVVFGPAPRSLPALPVKIVDGALTAAGGFLGKAGSHRS